MKLRLLRLRIRYTDWPVPAVELTDTPRPRCWKCDGDGGFEVESRRGHPEPETVLCDCWRPERAWLLTYVPRWIARRWLGWTDRPFDAPPF